MLRIAAYGQHVLLLLQDEGTLARDLKGGGRSSSSSSREEIYTWASGVGMVGAIWLFDMV